MSMLTDADVALLRETQLAHIATVGPDGAPHLTPVWVDTDGEHVVFNTARGRVKARDLERDPRVAVTVVDRANDYRTLWVQGTAELDEEGADAHIDFLARKYLGADSYPNRREGEVRVIVRVTPTRVLAHA